MRFDTAQVAGLSGPAPSSKQRRSRLGSAISGTDQWIPDVSESLAREQAGKFGMSVEQWLSWMAQLSAVDAKSVTPSQSLPRTLPGGRTRFGPSLLQMAGATSIPHHAYTSEDVRLVTRSTRAGRTPLSHYYQADNMIRRLGLWTPTLGWDLLPYSWFVDWFAGVSSRLKNNQFFELYPVDYAYACYQARVTIVVPSIEVQRNASGIKYRQRNSYAIGHNVSTVRKPVDPFGTGLRPPGLSLDSYRTAILVGLGLGKLR